MRLADFPRWRHPAGQVSVGPAGRWMVLIFLLWALAGKEIQAADALILGREVHIRQTPRLSAKVIRTARAGEIYEVIGRKPGKGQSLYTLDERGDLWLKVRAADEMNGYVRTDLISVTREEFRSPRGSSFLLVNLRPTADGTTSRELWVIPEGWKSARKLALIDGRPIWASHGEWFLCQVDSERPVKDETIERTIELIERFSADGRTHSLLAAGSYPILHEARGEVYFYRDVDEQGEAVPPGLFAVNADGTNLRPLFLLPEHYGFWKEDGDYFVQVPPPHLKASANRISLRAFDRMGTRVRFTVSLDGELVGQRPD